MRKNKVCIVDISTSVLPEDEESMTNTKYFVYKLIDSAFTKFRNSISANFNVIMPTIVSTFFRCVDAIIILSCLYEKEASSNLPKTILHFKANAFYKFFDMMY